MAEWEAEFKLGDKLVPKSHWLHPQNVGHTYHASFKNLDTNTVFRTYNVATISIRGRRPIFGVITEIINPLAVNEDPYVKIRKMYTTDQITPKMKTPENDVTELIIGEFDSTHYSLSHMHEIVYLASSKEEAETKKKSNGEGYFCTHIWDEETKRTRPHDFKILEGDWPHLFTAVSQSTKRKAPTACINKKKKKRRKVSKPIPPPPKRHNSDTLEDIVVDEVIMEDKRNIDNGGNKEEEKEDKDNEAEGDIAATQSAMKMETFDFEQVEFVLQPEDVTPSQGYISRDQPQLSLQSKEGYVILSLFDGMGGALMSLIRADVLIKRFYYSEIDPACHVVMNRAIEKACLVYGYEKDVFVKVKNDVTEITQEVLQDLKVKYKEDIDIVIASPPCSALSCLGQKKGFGDADTKANFAHVRVIIGWIASISGFPYFLVENVASMSKASKQKITDILGVPPVRLDAKHYSAARRNRYYWSNIRLDASSGVDNAILEINDILSQGKYMDGSKAYAITTGNYLKWTGITAAEVMTDEARNKLGRYNPVLTKTGKVECLKIKHVEIIQGFDAEWIGQSVDPNMSYSMKRKKLGVERHMITVKEARRLLGKAFSCQVVSLFFYAFSKSFDGESSKIKAHPLKQDTLSQWVIAEKPKPKPQQKPKHKPYLPREKTEKLEYYSSTKPKRKTSHKTKTKPKTKEPPKRTILDYMKQDDESSY